MVRGGLIMLVAGLSLAAAGCGGDQEVFAAAAEPAVAPPLTHRPAGNSFAVGSEPEGLVVDGHTGLAAVITRDPSALTLADLDTREVVDRVPLAATGRHLALASTGGPVLVPIEQADELNEVRLPSGALTAIAVGDHPHDATVARGRIFVGDEFGDTVTVLEGDRTVATLEAPEQPGGVAAAGGYVAVVAVAERLLEVYDARSLESVGRVPAGLGPTHVVADRHRAWVADTDGDAIRSFGLGADPRPLSTTALEGEPYGIAADGDRRRLWVTLTARNQLVEFDISGVQPVEIGRFSTLRQPNSVAVDPRSGEAVVAGRAGGRLEIIRGGR